MRMIVKKQLNAKIYIFTFFLQCCLISIGNSKETDDLVDKDHPLSIAKDNIPVEREHAEEEEVYELSSGDEDYSKGMRSMIFLSLSLHIYTKYLLLYDLKKYIILYYYFKKKKVDEILLASIVIFVVVLI